MATQLTYATAPRPKILPTWFTKVRGHEFGASEHLVQEMRLTDNEEFFNFTRLTLQQFDELLALVGKKANYEKDVILPNTRLLITLRCSNQVIQIN